VICCKYLISEAFCTDNRNGRPSMGGFTLIDLELSIHVVFFGAKLHALRKENGGLRLIAVDLTLRRLVSKIASHFAIERLLLKLFPRQLGEGSGDNFSCRPCFHKLMFTLSCTSQLDRVNAFNKLRQDSILEAVATEIPELLPYVISSCELSTNLSVGNFNLQSISRVTLWAPFFLV